MTRKDYIRAAEIVIAYNERGVSKDIREAMVEGYISLFKPDNPRFNSDRFREACEPSIAKTNKR